MSNRTDAKVVVFWTGGARSTFRFETDDAPFNEKTLRGSYGHGEGLAPAEAALKYARLWNARRPSHDPDAEAVVYVRSVGDWEKAESEMPNG